MVGKADVLSDYVWGDCGKGKDGERILKNGNYSLVIRPNGADNAGRHEKVKGIKVGMHQIPPGFKNPTMKLYLGNGCLTNPISLCEEISDVRNAGINLEGRLGISSKVSFIQPHHKYLDGLLGGGVGTTGKGIGFGYSDRAKRMHGNMQVDLRIGDYFVNKKSAEQIVKFNLEKLVNDFPQLGGKINIDKAWTLFKKAADKLESHVICDPMYVIRKLEVGENALINMANGYFLDLVEGTHPTVTSSRTGSAGGFLGAEVPLKYLGKVYGVAKFPMTRVGNGPFPSELGGDLSYDHCSEEGGYRYVAEIEKATFNVNEFLNAGDYFHLGIALRILGGEYGATTKRPRRMGMPDLVLLKQACMKNGADYLGINKFDCLEHFSRAKWLSGIPVVTGYKLDGESIDYLPTTNAECERLETVVDFIPHITEDITGIRRKEDLPNSVTNAVGIMQEYLGRKIDCIGVGPGNDQYVEL
ncbi:adenylosuccinate synthetase [archaeon]|jgi:adenylosuccinate synthase|nr:adenylosuccinate synthetase [archaeon]MBT3450638.1 adenylosuccinate synthetase [archaeon]MBT6868782.1 adenylosuccinate synthetase [archaeon]MBT7192997.1 adenylosuccinate synthetase [archaeon]MBT7380963.1 adenylosuccinate synthetase [archaeon]